MNRSQKILVTGAKFGQVGWELCRTLSTLGKIVPVDHAEADFTKPDELRRVVRTHNPTIIVNAAAYTAVDKAESEQELSMAINGIAPGILAEEAKACNALFVHYSTDYVFDGSGTEPYTEMTKTHPQNIYGETKLAGEKAVQEATDKHYIFRTSWVYGARGKNFLLTMLKLGRERDVLNIVADQIGAPTWSRTIAEATAQVLKYTLTTKEAGNYGIYNLVNSETTSWSGFAQEIFSLYKQIIDPQFVIPKVNPIATEEYPTPAKRPKNSRLDCSKICQTFDLVLPSWQEALALCLDELKAHITLPSLV
jgi:dTDP-4-dehydrorhamnose reductase